MDVMCVCVRVCVCVPSIYMSIGFYLFVSLEVCWKDDRLNLLDVHAFIRYVRERRGVNLFIPSLRFFDLSLSFFLTF